METRLVVSRLVGDRLGDDSITMLAREERGMKVFHLRTSNPRMEHQLAIKVASSSSSSHRDIQVVTALVNTDEKLHSKLQIAYSVQNSRGHMFESEILYNKLAQSFTVIGTDKTGTTEVHAAWRSRGEVHSQELELIRNNVRLVKTELNVNGHIPSITGKLTTHDRVDLLLFAGVEEESEARLKFSHASKGAEVDDLKLGVSLQNGNSISNSVMWRRDALSDIHTFLRGVAAALDNSDSVLWENLENTVKVLHTATTDITGDLIRLTNIELNQLFLDVKWVTSFVRRKAAGHDLEALVCYYMDSLDVFADFGVELADEFQVILRAATSTLNSATTQVFETAKKGIMFVKTRSTRTRTQLIQTLRGFDKIVANAGASVQEAVWKVKHVIDWVASRYHQLVAFYKQRSARMRAHLWSSFTNEVSKFLTMASDYLQQFAVLQKGVRLVNSVFVWLRDNQLRNNLKETWARVKQYTKDNLQFAVELWSRVDKVLQRGVSWLVEQVHQAAQWPLVQLLVNLTQSWFSLTRQIVGYCLKGYTFRHLTDLAISQFDFYTSTLLRVASFVYSNDELVSYEFIFKPEEGIFQYTQVLPILWTRFSEIPKIFNIFRPSEPMASPDVNSFYFNMHNLVRSLYQALSSKTVLPPFSATALLIGDNQFMTFDGKFYDFVGNCSYILSKDFNHNRFSVVANYKNAVRDSLVVKMQQGAYSIKINTDGKVLRGNTMIDLPFTLNETFIWKEGDRVTFLDKMGLQIICNLVFNTCSVKISGWYFGKTGGLLGVYDNEPSNDWMTSERAIVSDVGHFAESWKADSCSSAPYSPIQPDPSEWDRQKCREYFESTDSNMAPCFDVINPQTFLDVCLKQSEYVKSQPSASEGFCQVTSGYIELCKLNSVELRLPGECYSCQAVEKAPVRGGGFTKYFNGSAPHSADVILVVQQGSCLESLNLGSVLDLVERSLQERGMGSRIGNRYAVVGYGGPGQLLEPVTFTAASRVFTDHDTIQQALGRLSSRGSGGDVYDAITFAARIPTRAAVARLMLVITCDKVTDGSFYGDAIVMLKEGIIRLHYLNPAALTLKNKKSARTIFGYDKTSVFTSKSMNSRQGDPVLRRQMKVPKDYLSTLATESGGSVFSQAVISQENR